MRKFFVRALFWQFFSSYMYVVKAAKTTFEWKTRAYNIDEIDCWCQFHQRSTSSFCDRRSQKKKIDNLTVIFAIGGSGHVKAAHKTFMKLSPRVNFINTLHIAYSHPNPKSAKRYWQPDSILHVWDQSFCLKAAGKTLVKSTPSHVCTFRAFFDNQNLIVKAIKFKSHPYKLKKDLIFLNKIDPPHFLSCVNFINILREI